jgi:cobalt/nickel transport system ATP-binding protein
MSVPAIELRDVTVRYESGAAPVIEAASFKVAAGERVALVGLNGSGKTSLLMAMVGLVPHDGEIRVCGTALARRTAAEIRDRIGFLFNVPEDQLLFPRVIDDVAFGLLRRGLAQHEASDRASKALEALGVAHLAPWPLHHLSHGQKQRVALAGALASDPPVLLLDEPSAGLDPPGRVALAGRLGGLEAAMLVAAHDLDFAGRLCTRFILLEGGRVVSDGPGLDAVLQRWERAGP